MKKFLYLSFVALVTCCLGMPAWGQTYCTPTYYQGCAFGNEINDFFLTGEAGTSISDAASGCTSSGVIPMTCWNDETASTTVTLYQGNSYVVSADDNMTIPTGTDGIQMWIDFNNDGTFSSSESVGGGVMPYPSALTTYTITIPPSATLGTHRMRVEVSGDFAYPSINPCPNGSLPSPTDLHGEVHDYTVVIAAGTVSTCTTPTLSLGATTCSSQVINWTTVSSATYEYVINTTSGAPTGSGTSISATTYTATGLTASTTYYAHVRANCGSGSYSSWATISFTTSAGPASITGPSTVCPGSSITLSDATAGGAWSSGTTTIATVSGSTVYGVSAGTVYISYTVSGCSSTTSISVAPLPAISGTTSICPSSTTQLSDAVTGGAWTSSNTSVATVSGTGLVHSTTSTGTTVITYSASGCSTTTTVTVGSLPAITGNTTVCPGSTTNLSDPSPGGSWSSSNTTVATISAGGVVYATTNGTTVITYAIGSCTATTTVTVSPLPAITGGSTVCAGSALQLSDAATGGAWSSLNTAAATVVSSSGLVTGVSSGSTTIVYTLGGCSASATVTVGNAISPISGTTTFCITSSTTLSDATAGGTWSSSNAGVASTSGSTVHGVSAGTATISYSAGGCSVTATVQVDPNNAGAISGSATVCIGHTITLSDNVSGGVWSSSSTSRATVDPATGIVNGIAAGPVTIRYVVTNTCGTYTATYSMSVVASGSACTTGITAAEPQQTQLSVFPNPNPGSFVMNLSSGTNEDVRVLITNLVGQKVKEFSTTTNTQFDINLNGAPPGIYLLSAFTADGRYVAKVVVQ